MANQSLVSIPPDLEDPIVLRRFLARLVEQLDIVLGNRAGPSQQYIDQSQLLSVNNELILAIEKAKIALEQSIDLTNETRAAANTDEFTQRLQSVEDKNSEQDTTLDTYGTKLDTIEDGATTDQTPAEIKVAYESNADTNEFSDTEQSKLSGIESGATNTTELTPAEIKVAYESNIDTNEFSDAEQSKLLGIEVGAEANIGTNLGNTISSTEVTISSSTGTNTQIPSATPTLAGVMTAADKTKLNNASSTAEPYDNSDLYGIVTFMERV